MAQSANGSASPFVVRRTELSTFGKRLKAAMSLAGKSLEEVAAELEVSPKTVSRVMHGVREPRRPEVRHLAEVLGVPESFLLDGFGRDGLAALGRGDLSRRLEQIGELRRALDAEEVWLSRLLGDIGSRVS